MKTKISLIAGLALAVSAIALSGQTGAALPALEPGQGRFLTSEQRVVRQQQMQTTVATIIEGGIIPHSASTVIGVSSTMTMLTIQVGAGFEVCARSISEEFCV